MKKQLIIKSIFKYAIFLFVFYILGKVQIGYHALSPLGIALLFSMLVMKFKVLEASASFLIANILAQFSVNGIYTSLNVVIVVLITYLIMKKSKLKLNKYFAILPMLISVICYVFLNIADIKQNLTILLSLILLLIFYFVCINFLNAILKRGTIALNLDEKICGSNFLIALAMGLTSLNIYNFEFLKLIGVFSILICTYSFSSGTTFLLASMFGVGYAIVHFDLTYIALFVGFSLVSLAFKTNYRFLSSLSVLLIEILYGLFLKTYTNFNIITMLPVIIAAFLYVILPIKWLNTFKDLFAYRKDKVAVRSLVNRTKSGICKRMNELSQVFSEMDMVFRNMVKGVLAEEDANMLLTQECLSKVCANCPERHKCTRNNNTKDVVSSLVTCGFERGKVTLLDVPQYLTSKCGRINFLISTLNQQLKSYRNYAQLVGNMDASRVLIADQLGGVSEILKKLGEEIRLNITFDIEKENRILEELSYKNIVCFEAIVYEENRTSKSVSLLLKNEPVNKDLLEKAVSNACKTKMSVVSTDVSMIPNSVVVFLKNSPNFDLVFGNSSVSKNGVLKNGDAHSLIKIDNGKYILSLCDGIGSGEKAQKISNLSITLIENFYKAGFENDTILNSINKLLSLNNEENFSSVDLCVMDFHNNLIDFIKLGATYGFIKKSTGTEIIESSGLPIGVLEEMRPHITQKLIDPFDTIVLVSDGISDAFDNKSDLQDFINGLSSTNPQTIADEIMDRAKDLNNGVIKDDMTVLCVRIFPI